MPDDEFVSDAEDNSLFKNFVDKKNLLVIGFYDMSSIGIWQALISSESCSITAENNKDREVTENPHISGRPGVAIGPSRRSVQCAER